MKTGKEPLVKRPWKIISSGFFDEIRYFRGTKKRSRPFLYMDVTENIR